MVTPCRKGCFAVDFDVILRRRTNKKNVQTVHTPPHAPIALTCGQQRACVDRQPLCMIDVVLGRSQFRDSIVVSIPVCHTGDRGSIPRHGVMSYYVSIPLLV